MTGDRKCKETLCTALLACLHARFTLLQIPSSQTAFNTIHGATPESTAVITRFESRIVKELKVFIPDDSQTWNDLYDSRANKQDLTQAGSEIETAVDVD
ncbi:unnamed protein product [Orchesella dallaii]|uniref:Uncharacterized protein n=1 Tax=Orchesella dallaii TaxID=48710 RepID=A0ABP1QWL0_9HEXA